jgi:hypothetical protein
MINYSFSIRWKLVVCFAAKDTGTAAYRIMLNRDQLSHDPELLALVESNTTYRWIGAKRHIIVSFLSMHLQFHHHTLLG